jgi:transcriptional regulator with XRE-family HTH domain
VTAGGRARPGSGGAPTDRRRRGARAVDLAVARRVRERRAALGMTQQRLAALVGVTYQQLGRYEAGATRVSAGRLHRIAEALGVGVGHFFADVDAEGAGGVELDDTGQGQRRMVLDLLRHAADIRDPRHRDALGRLARDLAALGADALDDPRAERPGPPPEPQSGPDR